MKKTIQIKNLVIGKGQPKICVPLVGKTIAELQEEAAYLQTVNCDLVEWRVDFFANVHELEAVKSGLREIRKFLLDLPLIFTFRSKKEGGKVEISEEYYVALNETAIKSGDVDIIDIELFNAENTIRTLVQAAHEHSTAVIISNHDFEKTPQKKEIIARLKKAQYFGCDLAKIAVMPKNTADVLTLLDATATMNEQYAECPIITMSMAEKGAISRVIGEVFGSAITFASAKKASAPGQIAIVELRQMLELLHKNL